MLVKNKYNQAKSIIQEHYNMCKPNSITFRKINQIKKVHIQLYFKFNILN